MHQNVIDCLVERGFVDQMTSEDLRGHLQEPRKVYVGFDPTADSLHLGNLIPVMGLAWFQRFGHTPIAIVGGATGRIGDPSGKSSERPLLSEETLEHNVRCLDRFFQSIFPSASFLIVQNNKTMITSLPIAAAVMPSVATWCSLSYVALWAKMTNFGGVGIPTSSVRGLSRC